MAVWVVTPYHHPQLLRVQVAGPARETIRTGFSRAVFCAYGMIREAATYAKIPFQKRAPDVGNGD